MCLFDILSILFLLLALSTALLLWKQRPRYRGTYRPKRREPVGFHALTRPKPAWVRDEVLRLKALMPHNGCRKIATTFNHMHRRRLVSVGKSFVANVLKEEGHRLMEIRRKIGKRQPRPMPKNVLWALDLTFVREDNHNQAVFGLLDHGTRACLALKALPSKGSIVLLRTLLDAIERFGKPKTLRTDNEPIFTSKLFRLGLMILGIRHQRTAPFAPWQNGRIERFFGTFKQLWLLRAHHCTHLQLDLHLFRTWYNHARPHQNLDGDTPGQVWSQTGLSDRSPWFFSAWDGLLTGFYFPQ